jgi:hypothetical protein
MLPCLRSERLIGGEASDHDLMLGLMLDPLYLQPPRPCSGNVSVSHVPCLAAVAPTCSEHPIGGEAADYDLMLDVLSDIPEQYMQYCK